jgi:ligand-binding SRPBCC domain-containing protein
LAYRISKRANNIMKYQLIREHFLPINIYDSWSFFSSPLNLQLITPDDLGLVLLNNINSTMNVRDEYDYTVSPILGLKFKWKTKIILVEKPFRFIDKQIKGPYEFWEHLHTFEIVEGGVIMKDTINYIIPFGFVGRLFSSFIENKLENIFDYRESELNKLILDGSIN